jgi:signal transduction histidine kinase
MVYRDGLRVLPYGRPEFDWLRFEERRSKGASYYFFSYRRMFGYISINRRDNPQLIDKAGREGFIVNTAYRDFRELLESFFIYLAREFFKKDTPFSAAKEEINAERKKVDQERKRAVQQRKELREEAMSKLSFIRERAPEQLALAFREATERLESIQASDPSSVAYTLLRFEDRVAQVKGSARLVVPRNLSITRDRDLNRLKHDHDIVFEALSNHCDNIRAQFQQTVKARFPEAQDVAGRQRAIEQSYSQALARIGKAYKAIRTELEFQIKNLEKGIDDLHIQLRNKVEKVLLSSTGCASIEDAKTTQIENITGILGKMGEAAEDSVEQLQMQQKRLNSYLGGFFTESKDELIAAQTGEIEQLQEQVNQNLELVQLGLAVEIIDHDLTKLFLGIRSSLARLQNLLRSTPKAMRPLDDLKTSFTHLEQRFRLMSPIYRGSYRVKTEIDGRRIVAYSRDFLGHQLRSAGVELKSSESFNALRIREVEAVVLPVFVNIIDNAIYWLREVEGRRQILLDRLGDVVTVCDTGPGIHPTLLESIFDPFFSNKPNGRGLGLYIARANLQRYGHSIWATNDPELRTLSGACICIRFHEDVTLSE